MPPRPVEICLDCRVAPAEKKGRCLDCMRAYQRRVWLSRKSDAALRPCPICATPTNRANLCAACASSRASSRNKRPRAPKKPESWKNRPDPTPETVTVAPKLRGVRTARFVEQVEPDDPARAAVVDAILARRRAMTAKGAR
jgi:hypothetical protein